MSLPLRQQEMLQAVANSPGKSMRALHLKTNIPHATVIHTLMVLDGKGLVRRVRKQNGCNLSYECYLTEKGAGVLTGRCE